MIVREIYLVIRVWGGLMLIRGRFKAIHGPLTFGVVPQETPDKHQATPNTTIVIPSLLSEKAKSKSRRALKIRE